MHALPRPGHPAREMFAVADLVECGLGRVPPTIAEARSMARRFFAGANPAAKRVVYIVLLCDDRLALVSFGRRLGQKREWIFGPWKAAR